MSISDDIKKIGTFQLLRQLCMRIHNPQVIHAYTNLLDSENDENTPRAFLRRHLIVGKNDNFSEIVLKFLIFYLGCGRLQVSSILPTLWNTKADAYKPQLAISFRPEVRRRLKYGKYDDNSELHIPHYDPKQGQPVIPAYTVGMQSAKYALKDQSYILVNAMTVDEAVKVVSQLAKYTAEKMRPEGSIEENITTTKRKGKRINLYGQKMIPFKAAYFVGGREGISPNFTIQLGST
jgi:hypothetical protein